MRSLRLVKAVSAILLALLAGITMDPPTAGAQATCAQEIASIRAYTKRVDKLNKERQSPPSKRIFARLTNDAREWVELAGETEKTIGGVAESAVAWSTEGRIVAAELTRQSLTRTVIHRVMYYFREDGTLARISSTLTSFGGASIVVREEFYGRNGIALSKSSRHYTRRVSRSEPGQVAVEEPLPVYLRISEFPFYREIGHFAAPSRQH